MFINLSLTCINNGIISKEFFLRKKPCVDYLQVFD